MLVPAAALLQVFALRCPWIGAKVMGLSIGLSEITLLRRTWQAQHALGVKAVDWLHVGIMAVPVLAAVCGLLGVLRGRAGLVPTLLGGILGLGTAVFAYARLSGGVLGLPTALQYGYCLFAGAAIAVLACGLVDLYQASARD